MRKTVVTLAVGIFVLLAIYGLQNPIDLKFDNNGVAMEKTNAIMLAKDSNPATMEEWHREQVLPGKRSLSELEVWAIQSQYDSLLGTLKTNRELLGAAFRAAQTAPGKEEILAQSKDYLLNTLVGEVFPLWFGTDWDFNGITNKPQTGQIACGYFVSTTLKHAGFNLNRYKVAQQAASIITKTLCPAEDLQRMTSLKEVLQFVRNRESDIYVMGLDNHVGFLEKTENGIFFTHSSYYSPVKVVREKASVSQALNASENYVFAPLFAGDETLKKWLLGEPFPIRP